MTGRKLGAGGGWDDPPMTADAILEAVNLAPWDTGDYLRADYPIGAVGAADFDTGDDAPETDGADLDPSRAGALDGQSLTQVLIIPGEICGHDERAIWRRMLLHEALGMPPQSRPEALVKATRDALEAGGEKASLELVMVAVNLALASVAGVKVMTHVRGIARHMGIRYQRLARARRVALVNAERLGPWPYLAAGD